MKTQIISPAIIKKLGKIVIKEDIKLLKELAKH